MRSIFRPDLPAQPRGVCPWAANKCKKSPWPFPHPIEEETSRGGMKKRRDLLLDLGFWDSPSNNPHELELITTPSFYFTVPRFPPIAQYLATLSTLPSAPLSPTLRRVTSLMFSVHASSLGEGKG